MMMDDGNERGGLPQLFRPGKDITGGLACASLALHRKSGFWGKPTEGVTASNFGS